MELSRGEANRLLQRYSFAGIGYKGVTVISETSVVEVRLGQVIGDDVAQGEKQG